MDPIFMVTEVGACSGHGLHAGLQLGLGFAVMSISPPRRGKVRGVRQLFLLVEGLLLDEGMGDGPGRR